VVLASLLLSSCSVVHSATHPSADRADQGGTDLQMTAGTATTAGQRPAAVTTSTTAAPSLRATSSSAVKAAAPTTVNGRPSTTAGLPATTTSTTGAVQPTVLSTTSSSFSYVYTPTPAKGDGKCSRPALEDTAWTFVRAFNADDGAGLNAVIADSPRFDHFYTQERGHGPDRERATLFPYLHSVYQRGVQIDTATVRVVNYTESAPTPNSTGLSYGVVTYGAHGEIRIGLDCWTSRIYSTEWYFDFK